MQQRKQIVFIHSLGNVPEVVLEQMHRRTPDGFELHTLTSAAERETRRAMVEAADFVVLYGVPFDDLDVSGRLKLIQLLSAGYDRLDLDALRAAGIPLADNGGANAPTVAEHTVLLMLAVFKKLPMHHKALERGQWLGLREAVNMRELRGKQVGLIGVGRIGREVARIVNGFLANVVYFDPNVAAPPPDAKALSMDELLATSDVVSVHTPLNDATRGLMNAAAFAAMKESAVFINTARGPVVDEAALIAALERGQIAGAGLDVFEHEPIAADHPLLAMDNVVVTSHIAGTTIDTWTRRLDFAFENIMRVARGDAALSVVNA